MKYISGWFVLDFVAWVPYDLLQYALPLNAAGGRSLAGLRALRLLKLKLLRLLLECSGGTQTSQFITAYLPARWGQHAFHTQKGAYCAG